MSPNLQMTLNTEWPRAADSVTPETESFTTSWTSTTTNGPYAITGPFSMLYQDGEDSASYNSGCYHKLQHKSRDHYQDHIKTGSGLDMGYCSRWTFLTLLTSCWRPMTIHDCFNPLQRWPRTGPEYRQAPHWSRNWWTRLALHWDGVKRIYFLFGRFRFKLFL